METCVNYVPPELADEERSAPETLEKAAILRKAHVSGETPTVDSYLDVSSVL